MVNPYTLVQNNLVTELNSIGNNYVTYSFQNNETYIFYFYINAYDGLIYMSILDTSYNPIMADRRVILSNNLFGDTQLLGKITVEGTVPTVTTIDQSSFIYYNYYVLSS